MNRNEHIPPNWTAVKIDESIHCNPEFLERCGGKVYGIYLVDMNSVTHCCEITPSYYLHAVDLVAESYPDDDDARASLYDELMEVQSGEDGMYMHCRVVDKLPDDCKVAQYTPEDWAEDGESRGFDDVHESYVGNPAF